MSSTQGRNDIPVTSTQNTATNDNNTFTFDNMPSDERSKQKTSAQALSMTFMKSISGICCQDCGRDPMLPEASDDDDDNNKKNGMSNSPSELYNLQVFQQTNSTISNSSISPLVMAPMNGTATNFYQDMPTIEGLIGEYICLCQFYQVPYNAGIVTTLRFSLPSLRVSGSFHDLDMMALVELLLRHANGRLRYVHRLDFTVASKEGKQLSKSAKVGFTSHGALALAKALQSTKYIHQVWVSRHRIGPYGASALFLACRDNPTIHQLNLRRCRIGERGALAFCETFSNRGDENTNGPGLVDVDLSSNGIGHRGTSAIERAIQEWNRKSSTPLLVNLEGNLVFPEVR